MNQDIEQLKQEIENLKAGFKKLHASTTIPYEVGEAFKDRVTRDIAVLTLSGKAANYKDIAAVTSVNFGAQSTTTNSVLDNPSGYLQVTIGGTIYYLPYFL